MPEVELSEAAEELLAGLWTAEAGEAPAEAHASEADGSREQSISELTSLGLVEDRGGSLALTESGRREGAGIVRRERLAERLLTDVLNVSEGLVPETACRFEHLLRRGIDDRICTLLGHPRVCPHGSPIPPGPCCREGASAAGQVVSALADLQPGQGGVVAYIQSRRGEILQRLLAMGALPGTPVLLRQRFPSFVFDLGQGRLAVDAETAGDIYVRLDATRVPPPGPRWLPPPFRRLHPGRRGRRGREGPA
jgi:DtxR family Mn-dependent transcriptional regulator